MTEPQYRRNVLILISESASKVCEIVIYLGNPGLMYVADREHGLQPVQGRCTDSQGFPNPCSQGSITSGAMSADRLFPDIAKWGRLCPLVAISGHSTPDAEKSASSHLRTGAPSSDELENDHQHPMSMVALKEGASHEAPFERRLKPDAVRIGRENHIADVTHTSWITTPWRTQRQIAKGNAVVR